MESGVVAELEGAVKLMRHAVKIITNIVVPDLSAEDFQAVAGQLTEIDKLCNAQQVVRGVAGYLADKYRCGSLVGSRTPEAYIATLFPVSGFEARRIVTCGRDTYQPVKLSEITRELAGDTCVVDQDDNMPTGQVLAGERVAEAAARVHATEREAQQEAARIMVQKVPDSEYVRIMDRELLGLVGSSQRQTIRARALARAGDLSPEDFTVYLRALVSQANLANSDPCVDIKKRFITIGRPDRFGGARLTGYIPATSLALIEEALANANRPAASPTPHGSCQPGAGVAGSPTSRDDRTPGQRRHDALMAIIANKARYATEQSRSGVGSILVSMTTEELNEILVETDRAQLRRLVCMPRPTNTYAMINLAQLVGMGLAHWDMACLHDASTGNVLYCGRARRSASLVQKIALVAQELVCSYPGCDVPACLCDVHHIRPWSEGGATDIDNLTLRCRNHHMDNNDHRDPDLARGWADRDPVTGRIGHHTPPALGDRASGVEMNGSMKARQAAGYKIFRHQQKKHARQNIPDHHPLVLLPEDTVHSGTLSNQPATRRASGSSASGSPGRSVPLDRQKPAGEVRPLLESEIREAPAPGGRTTPGGWRPPESRTSG